MPIPCRYATVFTEHTMLHSLQPKDFVLPQQLQTPWECPECGCRFAFGRGLCPSRTTAWVTRKK